MLYISPMEVNEEKFKERKLALKELIVYSEDFLGSHLARIHLATTMDQLNDIYSDFMRYQGHEPEAKEAASQEEE